jgi:uroporphyrinogen III methyltransferase/synthase
LGAALKARGAEVTESSAYRAALPSNAAELIDALFAFKPDYVTFTSAAAARNVARVLGPDRLRDLAATSVFAAVGPVAAAGARNAGITVSLVPAEHSVEGLAEALMAHCRAGR